MSNFARKFNRRQTRATVLAAVKLSGCTCEPDIVLPPGGIQEGKNRIVTIKRDDDCPLCWTTPFSREFVASVNAGEWDP
jgi:hypothetical protein